MRTWPKRIVSLSALTIGLIACFAPGDDDVVDAIAPWLPEDTPALVALAEPEALLEALSGAWEQEALRPETWWAHGLDPTRALALARLPGDDPLWLASLGLGERELAEEELDELFDRLTEAHRVSLSEDRAFVLFSLSTPDPEAWRDATKAFEARGTGGSLAELETLQTLGTDPLLLLLNPEGLAEHSATPRFLRLLVSGLGDCVMRGAHESDHWGGELRCPEASQSTLKTLLATPRFEMVTPGAEAEARARLTLAPEGLMALWSELADTSPEVDRAHTAWLDLAANAGVSASTVLAEAFTGELNLAVTRWPLDARRPGLVARLGVRDEGLVDVLMSTWRAHLDDLPGVRVEDEQVGEHAGWTVEWLRQRDRDIAWTRDDGTLSVAYGAADLEDALTVNLEPELGLSDDDASVRLALGELFGLESALGDLTLDLRPEGEGLILDLGLERADEQSARQTLDVVAELVLERVAKARQAQVRRQLAALCDAIDLKAIDSGLPTSLSALPALEGLRDPWGEPFEYVQPARRVPHHRYDLCSRGPDRRTGTRDDLCHQ